MEGHVVRLHHLVVAFGNPTSTLKATATWGKELKREADWAEGGAVMTIRG